MSDRAFAVVGHDDLVHLVIGGRLSASWASFQLFDMRQTDKGHANVTSTTCRWRCTGAPASAGLEVVDKPITCMTCIAREDEHW